MTVSVRPRGDSFVFELGIGSRQKSQLMCSTAKRPRADINA